jgi:HD-GYP domain-containing protein (c-di-GMP phosphodiesterase class II)
MTEDRPYSTALGRRRALVELRRCAGSQFDPRVVDVFVAVSERHPEAPVTPLRAVS